MSKSSFARNLFSLIVVQLANYLAPLLILPYLGRVLGVQSYGHAVMLLSLIAIASIVIDYGFNISAIPRIIKDKSITNVNTLLSNILTIRLFIASSIGLIIYIASKIWWGFTLEGHVIWFMTLAFFGQALQMVYLFQALEKMKLITYVVMTTKLMFVLFVFLLVKSSHDVDFVVFAFALSNIIGGIVSMILVYKQGYRLRAISKVTFIDELVHSFPFFLSRSAVSIYTALNVLIIGGVVGKVEAGLYGSSEKLYQAAQSVTAPFNSVLYPYVLKKKNPMFLFKSVGLVSALLLLGCAISAYYSEWILTLVFGKEFILAAPTFSILIMIVPITFLSMNFGYPAFSLIGKIHVANKTVMLGALCHATIISLLFLCQKITTTNVASALMITEAVVCICRLSMFSYYYRHYGVKYDA